MRLRNFACFIFAVAAWGQVAVQGPQSVYEGQNVAAIDLVANPHRDVEPLRPLLVQKPGQPYSQSNVEASIKALEGTGQFPKVQVNVVADPAGLRLNFLLEPAFFLGMIDFPGGAHQFPYTRLLQVVNLPDEDPYVKARVGVSEQELQQFLRRNGFFQAAVHADSQIDDAHQIVNVTFSVTLGKRARVGTVSFKGTNDRESASLQHAVRSLRARFTGGLLKRGKSYSRERLRVATNLVRRELSEQRRLASHVTEDPPQYHPETNRADVSFTIDLGPVVNVQVTGARLSIWPFMSGRQRKKLIPIYSEGTLDPDLVQEGQRNLVDYFEKKGFFDAKVKTTFDRKPDQILVVYDINKGKKHKVDRIMVRGYHEIPEKDILPQIVVKKSHIWTHGSTSQKLVKQSVNNIEALYHDRGYEDVKVQPQTVDREPKVDVVFNIQEGLQTVVNNAGVTGNEHIPYSQLAPPVGIQLHPGAPFSPRLLNEDRNRISATYINHGYLNVAVKTQVNRNPHDPHRVDLVYTIEEHQLVRVSDVVYLGQRRTRQSLLTKTTQISNEAPMRRADMLAAESRLYDLGIFDWSSAGPRRPIVDQTEEAALVKVHETSRNEITYGFGFEVSHRGGNTPSGSVAVPGLPPVQLGNQKVAPSQSTFASPRGSVEITRRNMRGLGETASASLLLSRLDQRAITAYSQPHFVGSQWSSMTSFSIERTTENPLFAAGLGDASFQVERLISKKNNTRLQLRYDFNKTYLSHLLVPQLVLPRDRNVHLSTFSGSLIKDTRDKPLDAHRGMFSTLTLGITPEPLGSSASFTKLTGQYAFYKPFHSIVFANSVRLGLVKAIAGSFVPTSERYFSGGGTSLRGFPIDQAGPQRLVPFCNVLSGQTGCANVTVPVGGRQLFILNSEIRFPLGIMKALGGVVFYDGGNVYNAINLHNFVDNYTNTLGLGLRYATPIGPVRFDIGHNLNPVTGIKSTQYFITLGQAF
jgi:outer membrane protein insertion porin family